MGARQAALSLSRQFKPHESVDILSTGFAGALRRDLEPGHLILDIPDSDLAARALSCAQRLRLDASLGATADSDSVVATPEEKLRLGRATGALAVDMETKALKTWARERHLSAWAIRAVLDRVEDVLPPSAPEERSSKALIGYAVSHIRFLRSMPALAANRRRAIASLTMFFNAFLPELCR
jgi:nucleoside phosphorylase